MPMATTLLSGFPVTPFHSPLRIWWGGTTGQASSRQAEGEY